MAIEKGYILITRPLEEARVFARKLKAEGFEAKIEPMLEIVARDFDKPDLQDYQALIFTSVNAVRAFAAGIGLKNVKSVAGPCLCVGDRTAGEARAQGFSNVKSAKGTSDDLIDLIEKSIEQKEMPLLYVRGEHTSKPIEKIMKTMGYRIKPVVVYSAKAMTKLSPACIKAIKAGHIEAVTFFSKRTVDTFVREVKKNGLLKEFYSIKLLFLGDSMVESVRSYRKAQIHTAETSDAPGMLELIRKTCTRGSV